MNRGRGDAALTFGDESPELKKELKTEFLPKGKIANPEAAELFGLSAAAPHVNPMASKSGPARANTDSRSGVVIRRKWSAGQRSTVKKYFNKE